MLKSINDAVTFKPIYDKMTGKESNLTSDWNEGHKIQMARWDIRDENLFWSFEIFALLFIGLLILFAIYYSLRILSKKFKRQEN